MILRDRAKMTTEDFQVFTAADENYLIYLSACLMSITTQTKQSVLSITVIHSGISPANQKIISNYVQNPHKISWFEVTAKSCQAIGAPKELVEMAPCYYRLLCPYLAQANKALYIDADTITLDDITGLRSQSIGQHIFGAIEDWLSPTRNAVGNWLELGLSGEEPYFNSGLLLFDPIKWRQKKLTQKTIQVCKENTSFLLAQNKWPQNDQYGLNVVVKGQWYKLSSCWNHFSEIPPEDDTKIVHYLGQGKPDSDRCHPNFRQLFAEYAKSIKL